MTLDLINRTPEETEAAERIPVPPLAGYATDRAILYHTDGDAFLCIDRRDAEMSISYAGHDILLPGALVQSLAAFLKTWECRTILSQLPA